VCGGNGSSVLAVVLQDLSERSRLNKRYRSLFDSSADAVIVFSADNVIMEANQRASDLTGYPLHELIGKSTAELVPLEDRDNRDDKRPLLLAGEVVAPYRRTGLRKDGTQFIAEVTSGAVFNDDGSFSHFWSIIRDVTARERVEDTLRKLSRVVEQTPAVVMITGTDGVIEYVNPAFERVTGYSSAEAVGATPRLLKSGLTPPEVYRDMWTTIAAGNVWQGEMCNRKKTGELYWDLGTVSPIKSAQGIVTNFISVKEDITERKRVEEELLRHREHLEDLVNERTVELQNEISVRRQAEAALREKEQRLAEAQRIAQVGSWQWEAQSNALIWSDETYRICGVSPDESPPSYEAFLDLVWLADRDKVKRAMDEAVAEKRALTIEHLLMLPDGQQRNIYLTAVPTFDEQGNLTRMAGTMQDITERTRVRTALLEKERLTREMDIGRSIQLSMLPERMPRFDGWRFACHYQAASQVGGDFYDFLPLPHGKLGIIVGDVSGKGLPAALLMALSRSIVRTTALNMHSPARALTRSNLLLTEDYSGDEFVTVCYGVLDPAHGQLTFANGGHNRPLWLSSATGEVQEIVTSGTMLGIQPRVKLAELSMQIALNDVLVFYTDGLTEAMDVHGNQFGVERLSAALTAAASASAENILAAIKAAWRGFVGDAPEADDMTILVVKRSGDA
jgi:PAS domain S-box-containing protein